MNTRQRLYEFLFLGVVCGLAVWGMQFLPADQHARSIYASCLLVAAVMLAVAARRQAPWLRSASIWLTGIFAFLLVITFLV